MPRILIVFGTTDGHTLKIASAMRDAMIEAGAAVIVREPRREDPAPDAYDGVVVAASVHAGKFQKPIIGWVQAHAETLNRMPSAFVPVSLGILQREPAVQQEVKAIVARFFEGTGWKPSETLGVAGALLYTQYFWLKRWMMRRIAAKAGGDTDTSRDYVYTDWAAVREFAQKFARRVAAATPAVAVLSA
jgi:menaquinone-dependent protoporphyrinogen oxidase